MLVLVLACTLATGVAMAQETTGAIKGYVTSADGASLPGVAVAIVATETGLKRATVTDAQGMFHFPHLPPERYDLSATLDGFQTYHRNADVGLGRTVSASFEMQLGAITDVIEVTAEAPLVDVTSTVTGINVSAAEIDGMVPVVHDTQRLALLAPATTAGDTAFNGSGDGTYDQRLVSIGGSSVAENSYQVNGLNVTNFRTGVGSSWIPFEFVDEVQVKTGGYEAEFGRSTGGVVNMVTKSGTNSLRGSASVFYEPESLQEYEPNTAYAWNQNEERELAEVNASIGFPIVRDKLFFFGFVQYRDNDYLLNSLTRASRQKGSTPYYGGKVDWNITPSHRVDVTYLTDETSIDEYIYQIDDSGIPDETELSSQGTINRGGANYIGKYTGIWANNFMVSAQYGVNEFDRTNTATGDVYPYSFDATSGAYQALGNWTNWSRGLAYDEREAYRADIDWYLGNHSLRGGADYENNWSDDATTYSGGYRIAYSWNEDPESGELKYPDLAPDQMIADRRVYEAAGGYSTYSNAIYLQDSWAVTPNLTLNLGIRWEQYENKNLNDETFIKIDDQYAPRLGVIWDISGRGRSKLHASYGVYHLPIASNTNIRMSGAELYVADWLTVDSFNPDGTPNNLGTTPLESQRVYADGQVPDVRQVTAEDLTPMSQQEIIIGYEQMLGDDWSLGARGIMKNYASVIEDIGGDWAMYDILGIDIHSWWGILANPGDDVTAWYDVDGDGEVERYSFSKEDLGYPEAERNYYAVELTAKKRFSNNFMLDFSYTWSHSYGNFEGFVDSTIGQSDGGITQNFDYPGLAEYTYGDLPNDRRHNLKAFGVYAFDFGLQLGGNLYYYSGRPRNGMGVYPDPDNWAADYLVASFFVNGEPSPRGSYGTTDSIYGLDAMIKYAFQLGSGVELNLRLDAFNVANSSGITEVDEEGDNDAGGANPNWLTPTHYQSPRTIRLGVGITF
jgi:outer membrane receptor protein involved in Fe transport